MASRQNSTHSGYVLKFISGKYQGGEFPIETEGEIVIGRSSELDMVLVEDMVSRHHATITSSNGEIWIEDFGSTNGSFVNGEKITKARLKEGDRILIGTSIIKLVYEEPKDDAAGDAPRGGFASPPSRSASSTRHTQSGTTTGGILSGMIDQVPLPDLLQLFGASKKSGCLIIQADREGRVYMRDGRVYAATIDDDPDIPMEKAFYRMMAWTSGSFILDNTLHRDFGEAEIEISVESLMMEGMRLLDEIHNIGDDVPDYSAHMHLPVPLVPPLRDLTPELLDTLQLVHNYGRVETVLNKSLATDLETLQDLVYLIRNDYVRVE